MNSVLMRFPSTLRSYFLTHNRSNIIKMTSQHALLFNYLNANELDFAMGFEIFIGSDSLIPFKDMKNFYCSAGADLLTLLHAQYYNHELSMVEAIFIELSKQIRVITLEEARRLANLRKEEQTPK